MTEEKELLSHDDIRYIAKRIEAVPGIKKELISSMIRYMIKHEFDGKYNRKENLRIIYNALGPEYRRKFNR